MTDLAYPHVAERIFGRAHAIEPEAFRAIVESPIARRVLAGQGEQAGGGKKRKEQQRSATDIRRERLAATVDGEWCREGGEYFLTRDGVAIVPVCGILSLRYDWMAALCGWTTYEGLSATCDAIAADDRVKAVLMDVESPGGEAAGMIDIADKIIAMREKKRVWAVANAYAFSAAYAVAGSAERLLVPRLCQVGSIGAVAIHLDQSAFDAQMGLKYTAIYSGERKIDGWNHAPLSEGAQSAMQDRIDYCRDQFAALVGRQGRMTAAQAKGTEANIYHDQPAVEAKLADGVASFEDALAELSDFAAGRPRSAMAVATNTASMEGSSPMADQSKKAGDKIAAETPVTTETKELASTAAPAEAAATPPVPAAPAAAEPTPAQAVAAHHKCTKCGHEWDDGEDAPEKKDDEDAVGATAAILDLCASQGVSAARAKSFLDAKAPLDKVRADIAAEKAAAADALKTDATRTMPAVNAGWDEVAAKVNKEFGIKTPK